VDRDEVRRRLQAAYAPPDIRASLPDPGIPAAVLIGLLAHADGPNVVLTERSAHLKDHAAEISLPGGRMEADDGGPAATAMREAFEEIGLAPEKVEVLGRLPSYQTISGFSVHPFVGWIEPPVEFVLDAREVADVFQVPLSFVLDPANHHCGTIDREGEHHRFYVLPYPGRCIWGVTAGILVNLARTLAP
jgi:8-oxo-dGTP pyrophosphatase MutT (NUDIX family)